MQVVLDFGPVITFDGLHVLKLALIMSKLLSGGDDDLFLSKRVKFGTFKACFHVLMELV